MNSLKDRFTYPKKFDNLIYNTILPPQKKYNETNNIYKNKILDFKDEKYNLINKYIPNNIPINYEYNKKFEGDILKKLNINNIKYEKIQLYEKPATIDLFNDNIKYYNYLKTICLNKLPVIKKSNINKEKKNNDIINNIININNEKNTYLNSVEKEEDKINNINNLISYIIKTKQNPKEEDIKKIINNIIKLDNISHRLKQSLMDLNSVDIIKYLDYYQDNIINNLVKNKELVIDEKIYNELYKSEDNNFIYNLIKKNPNLLIINNILKLKKNHKEEILEKYNIKDEYNHLDIIYLPQKEIKEKKISKDVLKLNIKKCLELEAINNKENLRLEQNNNYNNIILNNKNIDYNINSDIKKDNIKYQNICDNIILNSNNIDYSIGSDIKKDNIKYKNIYDKITLNSNNINYNNINDIYKINNIYLNNLIFYLKKHNLLIENDIINKIRYCESSLKNTQYINPQPDTGILINKKNKINKEIYNKKINNLINFKNNNYKYDNINHCNVIENNNKELSRDFLLQNNYYQKIK